MKRYILTLLVITGIFITVRSERAEALVLPPADSVIAVTYGDFYSYSLPILVGLSDSYDKQYFHYTANEVNNAVVIATGSSGKPTNENFAGMDNAYPTPGDNSTSTDFDTAATTDPAPDLPYDRENTWDATLASLMTYLDGQMPVFFFNNNETDSTVDGESTQNLWIWTQIEVWSSQDPTLSMYYELTSTNGDGSGVFGGDPTAYDAHGEGYVPVKPDDLPNTPTDYVLSGGDICLDGGNSVVSCDTEGATLYVHNLGAADPAYAVIAPELNGFLEGWDENSPFDMISIDIKMTALNGGYEQAYIMPGTVMSAVPEPGTWLLLGLGLLGLPMARRLRRR